MPRVGSPVRRSEFVDTCSVSVDTRSKSGDTRSDSVDPIGRVARSAFGARRQDNLVARPAFGITETHVSTQLSGVRSSPRDVSGRLFAVRSPLVRLTGRYRRRSESHGAVSRLAFPVFGVNWTEQSGRPSVVRSLLTPRSGRLSGVRSLLTSRSPRLSGVRSLPASRSDRLAGVRTPHAMRSGRLARRSGSGGSKVTIARPVFEVRWHAVPVTWVQIGVNAQNFTSVPPRTSLPCA
jgi:hypothetical protein